MSTMVAVFAHPDDETFICGGTLAKYAQAGLDVALICATKGEMGRRMGVPPTATRETIATLRDVELRDACAALGITELQFMGYRDKSLEIQPIEKLVEDVYNRLEKLSPEVVITFHEAYGGHPDHCMIGRVTTLAFARYQVLHPEAVLYFVAWGNMRGQSSDLSGERFVEVDIRAHLFSKLQAFRAHRTQSELNEWLWRDDKSGMKHMGNVEYFLQYAKPYQANLTTLLSTLRPAR